MLNSDYLTQGPKIADFERAFSAYIVCKYAVAVSNGIPALHLCILALEVSKGEKVIRTPITFADSANCVKYVEGNVVFSDIYSEPHLIDIFGIEELLKSAPKGIYKGIIPVDFSDRPIDLKAFRKLADEFGSLIIEDACHASLGCFIDSKGIKQNCGNGDFAYLLSFLFIRLNILLGEKGV